MINKDYLNEFCSPIRKISGKAELYASSAATAQGNPVVAENVDETAATIDIQLTSKNLIDVGTLSTDTDKDKVIWQGELTGTFNFYAKYNYNWATSANKGAAQFALTVDGATVYTSVYQTSGRVFSGTLTRIKFLAWGTNNLTETGTVADIMLVEGETAPSEYIPYIEDFSAIPAPPPNLVASGFFDDTENNLAESYPFTLEQGKTYKLNVSTVDGTVPTLYIDIPDWGGASSPAYFWEANEAEFSHIYNTESFSLYMLGSYSNIASASLVEVGADTTKPAVVEVRGKNLFNPNLLLKSPSGGETYWKYENGYYYGKGIDLRTYYHPNGAKYECALVSDFAKNTQYTMSFKGWNDYDTVISTIGFYFAYTDGTSSSGVYLDTNGTEIEYILTSAAGKSVEALYATYANNPIAHITNIQVEQGTAASPYEEYVEPVEYEVNSEGKATISAIIPNTVIATGDYGIINATYSTMTLNNTFLASDHLSSITIDRDGESGKFFGFGIGQKATIKLIDKNREISVAKDNLIKTYFNIGDNDYVNNFPTFITETPTRNENTNEITIVANDKLTAAAAHTVEELGLMSYSIREFATACASLLGLKFEIRGLANESCFDTQYEEGANFSGKETLRQALNAVAEATQTIYFISGDNLVFKRLDNQAAADIAITKDDYFTLTNKDKYTIDSIASITELGDNVGTPGTQNVKDNPFWVLRDDIAELVENATAAITGLSINQFECKWRGNFLVELGDKLEITTKDDNTITGYLLNDSITYQGGYKQVSKWEYNAVEKPISNPTTIGEAIRQTTAKVDKVNKQIGLVVSETTANSEAISALQLTTNSITASVGGVRKEMDAANENISTLTNKVEAQLTPNDVIITVQNELDNGVNKVITGKGYALTDEGLSITDINPDTNNTITTTVSNNGMIVKANNEEKLVANDEGVKAVDLHAETFLIIGKNSRFEDFNGRTCCFWIGG